MTHSRNNGNPFPEKWTLVCRVNRGDDGFVEPCGTEDEARAAFATYKRRLRAGTSIASAHIIPPDGEGVVIMLAGAQPARV
jgi:hypothetical protein